MTSPTLKEGNSTRVMFRYLTTWNTGVSINQRKILPDMANTGGGDPIKRWKGSLMECK